MTMKTRNTTQRRKEITQLAEKLGGIFKLTPKDLAEKYNVTQAIIYRDLKIIIDSTPEEQREIIKYDLLKSYERGMGILNEIVEDKTTPKRDKYNAIRTLLSGGEQYTRVLEAWGLKDKVAERLEHDVKQGIQINILHPDMKYPELGGKKKNGK